MNVATTGKRRSGAPTAVGAGSWHPGWPAVPRPLVLRAGPFRDVRAPAICRCRLFAPEPPGWLRCEFPRLRPVCPWSDAVAATPPRHHHEDDSMNPGTIKTLGAAALGVAFAQPPQRVRPPPPPFRPTRPPRSAPSRSARPPSSSPVARRPSARSPASPATCRRSRTRCSRRSPAASPAAVVPEACSVGCRPAAFRSAAVCRGSAADSARPCARAVFRRPRGMRPVRPRGARPVATLR